ncbi:MAG TPA: hypothetical protein VFW75_06905 [Acetobacteraceae bacterium]|nr:hypothetical protein [Acetobacteraceae bacterium]
MHLEALLVVANAADQQKTPTMPLQISMTAANAVSRASSAQPGPGASMMATISPTSMTVTAMASTRVPNGSPMRRAITSAWRTAANTVPIRTTAITAANAPPTRAQGRQSAGSRRARATPRPTTASILRGRSSQPLRVVTGRTGGGAASWIGAAAAIRRGRYPPPPSARQPWRAFMRGFFLLMT